MPYENLPGYGTPLPEPSKLPAYGTGASAFGTLPSGGTKSSGSALSSEGGSGGGGFDWGGLAKGGIPLIASLFAPKTRSINPEINQIEGQAGALSQKGKEIGKSGADALGPALALYKALASGNPADLLAATAGDRARVMDQYDAARKSISTTGARGGGMASATSALKAKEASDLATLPAKARMEGVDKLASIGLSQQQTGLSAEEQSIQAMTSVLQPIMDQAKQDKGGITSFFSGLADFIGPLIFGL